MGLLSLSIILFRFLLESLFQENFKPGHLPRVRSAHGKVHSSVSCHPMQAQPIPRQLLELLHLCFPGVTGSNARTSRGHRPGSLSTQRFQGLSHLALEKERHPFLFFALHPHDFGEIFPFKSPYRYLSSPCTTSSGWCYESPQTGFWDRFSEFCIDGLELFFRACGDLTYYDLS